MVPLFVQSIQTDLASLFGQSIQLRNMMCLSPISSMKPHQVEVQLVWVLDLVVVGVHAEMHQLLQPRQEPLACFPVLI